MSGAAPASPEVVAIEICTSALQNLVRHPLVNECRYKYAGGTKLPRSEEVYDILDVIRVVRGVWVAAAVVAATAACLVGLWAFPSAREVADLSGVEAIITVPTGSVGMSDVRKELLAIATASGEAGPSFAPAIEEIPSEAGPTYRSLRVRISSPVSRDEGQWLDEVVRRISVAVDQYDADINQQSAEIDRRRHLIEGLLDRLVTTTETQSAVTTAATASAFASLVSTLSDLEDDTRELAERGRGPLVVTKSEPPSVVVSNLQWLRFPIVAAIAGVLAVLLVGFTIDGIRLAEARRRQKT